MKKQYIVDWYWIAAIGGAATLLAITLLLPLGFDNDLYESMGWALYAYHGLPYIGSWDHNFPGIVFIHWSSITLFGASDFGFRLFDYVVHIAMAALYYRLLRNWLSPRASLIGVMLYALYYASGLWGLAGQRDTYVGFLLIASVILFYSIQNNRGRKSIYSFLIGIFCGLSFLLRPTYAFFGLSFFILLWIETKNIRTLLLYLTGCVLPSFLFLLPYFFIPNGILQVYNTIIRFNLEVYSSVHVPINVVSNGRFPIYAFAAIGIWSSLRNHSKSKKDRTMFLLLAASALISPVMMGKYFSYHLEPLLILLIGFAALGFEQLLSYVKIPMVQIASIILGFLLFIYAYYPRQLLRYFVEAHGSSSERIEAVYEQVLSDSLFGLARQQQVIAFVDRGVPVNARVEYVSIFPSLRWRLRRMAPTRFTSIVPLSAYQRMVPAYSAGWRKEFIDTLITDPAPLLIVSRSQTWWPFVGKTNDSAIRSIPKFDSVLATNYTFDTAIGGYAIYRSRK
ncbi:MAG TPA: glycosyltransferase family 39 protein [Candidatus Kapabacteria bacterium]